MTKTNETEALGLSKAALRALLVGGTSMMAIGFSGALAQDDVEDGPEGVVTLADEDELEELDRNDDDKVVVTGSRLRRDTFSSVAPLQVITVENSLDVGLVDPSQILQSSTAAAGQQFDSTFQGFVLDNGPGSETLNLRGLGAGRTLLLLNGRRLAPAGVEGAPTNPSINLLPGSLIERYDLLLDGASSIYGSDAVAGVGNVILRKDFDGLELFGAGDYNIAGAGHDFTVSAAYGINTDRGFIGLGAEFDYNDEVTFGDRTFLAGCNSHYEVTEDGEIRRTDLGSAYQTEQDTQGLISAKKGICKQGGFTNRLFEQDPDLFFGSAYATPGGGNIIPGYSDTGLFGVPIDQDRDGIADIYFPDYSTAGQFPQESLFAEQQRISVMAYGEHTFDGDSNLTPFFEILYTSNDIESNSGPGVVSAVVPAENPFNICNPNAPGGFDCGVLEDELLTSDAYIDAFQAYYNGGGGSPNCFGVPDPFCTPATFGLLTGPVGPTLINPQVSVPGHFDKVDVTLEQWRGVAGFRADLPWLNAGSLSDWNFESSITYSYSEGTAARSGVREDRLALSLGYDPTLDLNGNGIADDVDLSNGSLYLDQDNLLAGGACDIGDVENPDLLRDDVATGCVPVNLFAPSLYSPPERGLAGDFASQAERDYLFDDRDFKTIYEQTVLSAFVAGSVFEMPAGSVGLVLGGEYRLDEIDSQPDDVAEFGLFPGFFRDRGAVGEKYTAEAYGEIEVPLLADAPFAQELTLNLSGRFTEDELAGSGTTYSGKLAWRPVTSLLLKGTYGTSFKAPNLREQFFAGQSGFGGIADPCAPPSEFITLQPDGSFEYNPGADADGDGINDADPRDPGVIAACRRENRDPTTVGVVGTSTQVLGASPEVFTVGSRDLENETSTSYSVGFAFEQPWTDAFDLTFGATYYDISIEDAIVELGFGTIVNGCFSPDPGRSPFCDQIRYAPPFGLISEVDTTFINRDEETAVGIDYNIRFGKEFVAFDQPMEFDLNLRANQLKERQVTFLDRDTGDIIFSDDQTGEFSFPEWQGFATGVLSMGDYAATWETRYIDGVQDDVLFPFSDATQSANSNTCLGPTEGDVLCRDVNEADDYYVHTLGLRYSGDTWLIRAGVRNVFDTEPPRVDSTTNTTVRSNTPLGAGYDLNGREYFLSVRKDFN